VVQTRGRHGHDPPSGLRIISFITDPPVVDRILRHLKWRPGDALLPGSRSPPAMLAVAESS